MKDLLDCLPEYTLWAAGSLLFGSVFGSVLRAVMAANGL